MREFWVLQSKSNFGYLKETQEKMKKFLWLMVIVLIVVAIPQSMIQGQDELPYNLTPGKPYDGTTINFLICCPTAGQFAAWQKRTTEDFTPMTGIEVVFANEAWGSFQERIVTESIAGAGYDVTLWQDAWGPAFIDTLEPLESYIERDGIDYVSDYPQGFIVSGYNSSEQLIGFPVRTHPFVLYYRTDIFEQLGLEVPTTWDEVFAASETIQAETDLVGMANYYGVATAQNLFVWSVMLKGMGSDIFDADYQPIFNNEAGVAATDLYMRLRDYGQESQFTDAEGEASIAMSSGNAAMLINWWWRYGDVFSNPEIAVEGVYGNVGVASVPAVAGEEPVNYVLSHLIGISGASPNKDAAWEFLKFLSNPDFDLEVALDKSDPATSNVVISHTSLFTNDEYNAANADLGIAAAAGLDTAAYQPLISEWAEVSSILEAAINEIALGADTQATLDEAAADVQAVMERAGYYD
jgi:multiple sugar transport system substrate-binding protein